MMMRRVFILCGALCVFALGAFELRDGGALRALYRDARHELSDWNLARRLSTVDCPAKAFVILAIGQSNAGNHLGSRSVTPNGAQTFASFRGRCVPLNDPVPGATGDLGSLWPMVAGIVQRQTGIPVVVIAGAAGGSSVADWNEDVRRIRSRVVRSAQAAVAANLSPDAAIWIQGESDARETTMQAYEAGLRQIIASIDAEITAAQAKAGKGRKGPEWIISRTSRCAELRATGSEAVREAQEHVASTTRNARLGPNTDALGDEFRRDGCHFNDAGRSVLAEQLAALLLPKAKSTQ